MTRCTALITVYNEETWIAQAVKSLLNQSLSDIEILIIDDGSTDLTSEILASFDDPRIRILCLERMGRASALLVGVEQAIGDYVAILDADDESYPNRLKKQVAFLDAHPSIAWLGCGEERRDDQRGEFAERLYPTGDAAIRRMSARCIPYSHSGVMFRKSLAHEGLNYDPEVPYLIDFEFFLRVAEKHQVANLDEVLVMRRLRHESFFQSRFKRRAQNRTLARFSARAVRRFDLPLWHLSFPLARLGYDLIPNSLKQSIRNKAGLRENFGAIK